MNSPDTSGPLTTQAVPPPHTSSLLLTPRPPGSQPTGGPSHAARGVVTDEVPDHPTCEAARAGRLDHRGTGARRQREGDRLPRQSAIGHAHGTLGVRARLAWGCGPRQRSGRHEALPDVHRVGPVPGDAPRGWDGRRWEPQRCRACPQPARCRAAYAAAPSRAVRGRPADRCRRHFDSRAQGLWATALVL